jgi:hypothetical protein
MGTQLPDKRTAPSQDKRRDRKVIKRENANINSAEKLSPQTQNLKK